jgi:hypothetical protein
MEEVMAPHRQEAILPQGGLQVIPPQGLDSLRVDIHPKVILGRAPDIQGDLPHHKELLHPQLQLLGDPHLQHPHLNHPLPPKPKENIPICAISVFINFSNISISLYIN